MKKLTFLILFITMSFFGFSQEEDWFEYNRYQANNERIKANQDYPLVVFMGNSITDNWAYFHPGFFIDNHFCGRGISGQTTAQMLVRFMADVVELQPKAVVIMAGTNDVAHNEFYIAPEHVVENIIAMCQLAQSNGIIPIISSIPPCSEFPWRKEIVNPGQTIVDINRSLKTYAEANQIEYVDYHSALADEHLGFPKTLSDDGCHPDPDTYFTMENLVLQAINKVLKNSSKEE